MDVPAALAAISAAREAALWLEVTEVSRLIDADDPGELAKLHDEAKAAIGDIALLARTASREAGRLLALRRTGRSLPYVLVEGLGQVKAEYPSGREAWQTDTIARRVLAHAFPDDIDADGNPVPQRVPPVEAWKVIADVAHVDYFRVGGVDKATGELHGLAARGIGDEDELWVVKRAQLDADGVPLDVTVTIVPMDVGLAHPKIKAGESKPRRTAAEAAEPTPEASGAAA